MVDLSQLSDEELMAIAGSAPAPSSGSAPLSVRNNNPGNMRAADGGFQQFASPQDGLAAMQRDLEIKASGNSQAMKARYGEGYQPTLANIITTWAPPTENDTGAYVNNVSKATGLTPHTLVAKSDIPLISAAMVRQEGGDRAVQHFQQATPAASVDLSSLSDDELMAAAGISSEPNYPTQQVQQTIAPPQAANPMLDEIKAGLADKVAALENNGQRYQSGQIGLPAYAALQAGEVLKSSGDAVGYAAGKLTPDFVKEGIGSLANSAANTDLGRRLADAFSAAKASYADKAQYSPNAAAFAEAGWDALQGLAPSRGAKAAGPLIAQAEGIAKVPGQALESSGVAAAATKKAEFVQNLVMPKETQKVLAGQTRVETGLNRTQQVIPQALEKKVADSVASIPEVKASNSLLGNENAIQNAYVKEAQSLAERLKNSDAKISDDDVQNVLINARDKALSNITVGVGGEVQANKVINEALEAITKNDLSTPGGLLQARKDFDAEVLRQRGQSTFDPNTENALTTAVKEVRQGLNGLIGNAVPEAGVLQSLEKQFHFNIALDNVAAKRAAEPTTRLARAFKAAQDKVSLKSAVLATTALGGAALAGVAAPAIAVGAGLYGAGKLAAAPSTRIALGRALSMSDYEKAFKDMTRKK